MKRRTYFFAFVCLLLLAAAFALAPGQRARSAAPTLQTSPPAGPAGGAQAQEGGRTAAR